MQAAIACIAACLHCPSVGGWHCWWCHTQETSTHWWCLQTVGHMPATGRWNTHTHTGRTTANAHTQMVLSLTTPSSRHSTQQLAPGQAKLPCRVFLQSWKLTHTHTLALPVCFYTHQHTRTQPQTHTKSTGVSDHTTVLDPTNPEPYPSSSQSCCGWYFVVAECCIHVVAPARQACSACMHVQCSGIAAAGVVSAWCAH